MVRFPTGREEWRMVALMDRSDASDSCACVSPHFPPFPLRGRSGARRTGEALSAGGIPGDIASLSACLAVILRRGRCGRGVRHAILVPGRAHGERSQRYPAP